MSTINDYNFMTISGHLNLDNVLREVKFLHNELADKEDDFLTFDDREMKQRVINFVNEIKKL